MDAMDLFKQERSNKMEITCVNCQQTWDVPAGHLLAAKLKFGLGFKEHTFTCPNCGAKNVISEHEFETADHPSPQIPVTGTQPGSETTNEVREPLRRLVGRAPINPVPGPGPNVRKRHGLVRVRSLPVRRDHSTRAETMAGLRKGEEVTILGTWTDAEDTWAQLGPERWAAIEHNGDALIELIDD
jgi:hypothetical protein